MHYAIVVEYHSIDKSSFSKGGVLGGGALPCGRPREIWSEFVTSK